MKAYGGAGGKGPRFGQVTVCWAESEEEGKQIAHEWWPNAALSGDLNQELATPEDFEEASEMVDEDDVAELIACGPDPERHLELIRQFSEPAHANAVNLIQELPDGASAELLRSKGREYERAALMIAMTTRRSACSSSTRWRRSRWCASSRAVSRW